MLRMPPTRCKLPTHNTWAWWATWRQGGSVPMPRSLGTLIRGSWPRDTKNKLSKMVPNAKTGIRDASLLDDRIKGSSLLSKSKDPLIFLWSWKGCEDLETFRKEAFVWEYSECSCNQILRFSSQRCVWDFSVTVKFVKSAIKKSS